MSALPVAGSAETRAAVAALVRRRRAAALALAVLAAGTASALAIPALLGQIVDLVVDGRPADDVTLPVLGVLAATVGQALLVALGQALIASVGESALAELREDVVEYALRLPLGEVERAGTGDLVARVGDDVAIAATAVRTALPGLASSGLMIAATVVGLAALDWRLALAGLCAVPVQVWTVRWYLRRAAPAYAAERAASADCTLTLLESVGGARTVRAFGLEAAHVAQVAERSSTAVDLTMRAVRLQTRFYGRLNVAELVGTAAILVAGFALVRDGAVSVGQATAAVLYFIRLFDPINVLLGLLDDAQQAAACIARLVGVTQVALPAEPAEPASPADASVSVVGARFAYVAGRDVVRGVDLEVAPGERVALVGISGAGKTTLAKLVAGVHTVDGGQVRLGGAAVAALGSAATSRTVGMVSQDVHVFAGPLAEDLRLAAPAADEAALRDALVQVGALDWALGLPDGLDTVIGEGGHRLTSGEAQQLALARLVLADPPIAILDEATADAGSAGARVLERAAERALRGRTAIVVAHRLTQAAAADRIVVLDDGAVAEAGTHAELVAADGGYARLWSAWSRERPGDG